MNRTAIPCSSGALTIASIMASGLLVAQTQSQVAFPERYREWTHVKSMVILEGHGHYLAFGGFHHVYANDKAVAALKMNLSFPKGSVLVFDLFEERVEDGAILEGSRKVIGVMEKDPDRFPDTEGWGFEDFRNGDPNQRSVTDMRGQCLSCHESQRASDYVYSRYRG